MGAYVHIPFSLSLALPLIVEVEKDGLSQLTQLEQTRKTKKNVSGIAKELRKLHRHQQTGNCCCGSFRNRCICSYFYPTWSDNDGMAVASHPYMLFQSVSH